MKLSKDQENVLIILSILHQGRELTAADLDKYRPKDNSGKQTKVLFENGLISINRKTMKVRITKKGLKAIAHLLIAKELEQA